jgi:hypothetical protein
MELVESRVLDGGGIARSPEEGGELPDHAQIARRCLRCELAYARVVDHARAQRTDTLAVVTLLPLNDEADGLGGCQRTCRVTSCELL